MQWWVRGPSGSTGLFNHGVNFKLFAKFKAPFPQTPAKLSTPLWYLGSPVVYLPRVHLSLALQTSHAASCRPALPRTPSPPKRRAANSSALFQAQCRRQALQEGCWGHLSPSRTALGSLTCVSSCTSHPPSRFNSWLFRLPLGFVFHQVWPRHPCIRISRATTGEWDL